MVRFFQLVSNCLLGPAFAIALIAHANTANGASFKVLHSFAGGLDGCYPVASLILDGSGNLYGTTSGEGCNSCGTIFEVPSGGTETPLYGFTCGSNGEGPGGLVMDKKANLYGTTVDGGSAGCGVVFKLARKKRETTVHEFSGEPNDGCNPESALIIGKNGDFYGTTNGGGKNLSNGTVFRLTPHHVETVLYDFCAKANCADGGSPYAGLTADAAGNLYGTTERGGSRHCKFECGALFKLAPHGTEKILYAFKGSPDDGSIPDGNVVIDQMGNLYGSLYVGGRRGCYANLGCGAIFKIAPHGKETILRLFKGGRKDGANPVAGPILDGNGNLLGTTYYGGNQDCGLGCGTVFAIAPDRAMTILHEFNGATDGANPTAGLVVDSLGNLYGATTFGGASGYGTLFEITP